MDFLRRTNATMTRFRPVMRAVVLSIFFIFGIGQYVTACSHVDTHRDSPSDSAADQPPWTPSNLTDGEETELRGEAARLAISLVLSESQTEEQDHIFAMGKLLHRPGKTILQVSAHGISADGERIENLFHRPFPEIENARRICIFWQAFDHQGELICFVAYELKHPVNLGVALLGE